MPSSWLAVEAGTDLLARARQIQRSWESLLVDGALDQELPPQATAGLRPAIVESWRRVRANGLDPTDLLPSIEADPSETRERWLEHPLGSLRHVLVGQLEPLAVESKSVVQVTDASGLTLHLGGPAWLKAKAAEMNLVEGARCSETVNGTNGVGTALAVDHPVQVFAFEHFSHHHREWVCSGAPIHDLVSGRLVGIIDLSSPWRIAHPRSLELVSTAARRTEQCLLEARRDHDARLRRRYGDLTTKSTDLLVNREGHVLTVYDSAHPTPLNVPEGGGEIAMDDGSLAVAEPLGRGEAYLVRRPGPRRARAARDEALERAEGRARERAKKRAVPPHADDPGCAGEVESGLRSPSAGERLSAYLDAAIDCVIVADASGRIVEFNPASERTFGYSRNEALGRTMAELIVPPSLRERHIDAFARFVKTREGSMLGRRVELTGMRADGSEFPAELALSQVDAEPVLICGALRDISATKEAESHLRELADEQAALRRVATLVAYESSSDRIVALVAEQVARVFDVPLVRLIRYESNDSVVIGGFSESADEPFPIGSRFQLDTPGLVSTIRQTGRAARVEDYTQTPGDGAAVARAAGMHSAVGSPIVVEGRVWGAIVLLSPRRASLPEDTGARLADFTELVATAIANTESRAELAASEARARELAGEQAALRRVATLVAKGVSSDELFAAVIREAADVLGVPVVALQRYGPDRMFTMVAIAGETRFTVGSRWPVEDEGLAGIILATGRPARKQDYTTMSGPLGAALRDGGLISAVGVPIVVEGSIWGFMTAGARPGKPIPDGTEERLARFTELVASAIADSQAREELAQLASEQAALRRVATMVAQQSPPAEVFAGIDRGPPSEQLFSTVAREVASVLDVPGVIVTRYDADGTAVTVGEAFGPDLRGAERFLGVGTPMPPDPGTLTALVFDTHDPARVDDLSTSPGAVGEVARAARLGSGCAGPIVVNGAVWGKMCVFSRVGEILPAGTENRLHDFIELVATAIANYEARAGLASSEARARELADEQAALRRVATLVAREASPVELLAAVAAEVARVLGVEAVGMQRFEPDGTATLVAQSDTPWDPPPLGTSFTLEGENVVTAVFRTGEAARLDDWAKATGPVAEMARVLGIRSSVATPIVVEGRLWGTLIAVTSQSEPLPRETDSRIGQFTELVATAIANAEARDEVSRLLEEQAALRRVATLVARGVSPEEIFSAVTNEMAQLFGSPQACVGRFEPDGSAMVVVGVSDGIRGISIGSRWALEDYMASTGVYRTGHPVRFEQSDLEHVSGPMADVLREIGAVSNVGAPIVVQGKRWGFVTVTDVSRRLPADAEKRLEKFAELVATAIANAESRAELAASERRAGDLAREQAALSRVATLVARAASQADVFDVVVQEAYRLFGEDVAFLLRYESDGSPVIAATQGAPAEFTPGTRLSREGDGVPARVWRTGRAARLDSYENVSGRDAARARSLGVRGSAGAPIVVAGRVWGVIVVMTRRDARPVATEGRLAQFAELVATAIANGESRAELAASEARARELAEEQASLRRVATLVAEGAAPNEVFDAVIAEVGQLLGAAQIGLARYENEHEISVLAIRGQSNEILRAGVRLPLDGDSVNARILRTGRSARLNFGEEGSGSIAEVLRPDHVNATVGAPIVVDGALWGMIGASWRGDDQPPADAEERLAQFAELLATSVSNAVMRTALAASRARVIAAADESRRRIERDLHDGAQQQLVTLAVALQRAQAKIPSELGEVRADVGRVADGLTGAVNGLRDLSRGIHPAILTEGGLSPALKALGRRTEVRVKLDVGFEHRLPDQVERAAYYTVSEALTNASKHANATRVWVSLRVDDDTLVLSIRDDGVGGADASRGSGLTGLRDRIEALGGKIQIKSPSGAGTLIDVEIPIAGPADRGGEQNGPPARATAPGSPW